MSRPEPLPASKKEKVWPIAAELGQQIQALVTGGEQITEIEPQETFGTRVLGVVLTFFELVRKETTNIVTNFAGWSELTAWFTQQVTDTVLSERWKIIWERLLIVVGGAFAAGWLADLILLPARRGISRRRPATMSAKFGTLVAWFVVSLVPVVVFLGAALALMDQSQPVKVVRFVVMTVVYGLAILRLIRLGIRFLLAPKSSNLRLVPLSDHQAKFMQGWMNALSLVMVGAYFIVEVAKLVRIPAATISAFSSIAGLVVVIMGIALIVKVRPHVSTFFRGDLSVARHGLSLWQSLRLWLARTWHALAIAYLVIGYLVTTFSEDGGFVVMERGTIFTLLVIFAVATALHWVARLTARRHRESDVITPGVFFPVFRALMKVIIWAAGAAGVAAAWGANVEGVLLSPWGQRVLGSAFTITATIMIVVVVYELLYAAIERRLRKKDADGNELAANARARTLLPMLRNAAMIVLGLIVGLVTLSELGVNIGPLLAGAGVIGVAIGFGSQALIKDFLTGLFIIIEDTIAVGDVVAIGEHSGVVESITIRTVRLRDLNGAMHVLPFGEITKFINRTKGFSFAVMDLSVAYNSDLRKVIEVVRDEGTKLEQDPALRDMVMEPIEVLGVENFADSSIAIRARIKTQPGKQWEVRRAFLLRIKERFDAENIEIPFPTVTHVVKQQAPN